MLQTTLKEATKSHHSQLEQLMFVNEIMNGTLTVPQYKQLLTTNYLVHLACEGFIFGSLSAAMADKLHINKRGKINALIADMEELKMAVPVKSNNSPLFTINKNDASALGALYVLEGATLGGNAILKKLVSNKAITGLNVNFHYYNIYGSNLFIYWKEFCEVLNQQPAEMCNESVHAAQQMFTHIISVQQQTCNPIS